MNKKFRGGSAEPLTDYATALCYIWIYYIKKYGLINFLSTLYYVILKIVNDCIKFIVEGCTIIKKKVVLFRYLDI